MEKPDVFSVPRRFDLATVLVAMSAFAILFAGLLLLDARPSMLAIIGGFIATVGLGQGLAAKWNRPRAASMIAGALFWLLFFAFAMTMASPHAGWPCALVGMVISAVTWGTVTGYLAGALVGGVFLVSHYLREWLGRSERDFIAEQPKSESPWEEKHPLDE